MPFLRSSPKSLSMDVLVPHFGVRVALIYFISSISIFQMVFSDNAKDIGSTYSYVCKMMERAASSSVVLVPSCCCLSILGSVHIVHRVLCIHLYNTYTKTGHSVVSFGHIEHIEHIWLHISVSLNIFGLMGQASHNNTIDGTTHRTQTNERRTNNAKN